MEVYLYSPLCLYGKHVDIFTCMLAVLINILLKIFDLDNLIHNYAVYWMFVIYFSLLHGSGKHYLTECTVKCDKIA